MVNSWAWYLVDKTQLFGGLQPKKKKKKRFVNGPSKESLILTPNKERSVSLWQQIKSDNC
jgi:hypothetical protein